MLHRDNWNKHNNDSDHAVCLGFTNVIDGERSRFSDENKFYVNFNF